ncbi:MAG: zinc ribbon domain-containing protein [Clostridia bacterium]|nr:zinc ribbon domain-containing protein [Clostridia bacterium]
MSKKIEALWDCPFCGNKGIGGLTKSCPGCGKPQHENTVFYLPEEKNAFLDDDTAAKYGQGADWLCANCGTMNRITAAYCTNCGSAKTDSKDDYFTNEEKLKAKAAAKAAAMQPAPAPKKKRWWPLLLLAVLVIALVINLIPKNADTTVLEKAWARAVSIEEYTTVTEADWQLPEGARLIKTSQAIHHYEKVVDHYEYVTVKKSRQVQDGYDTSTQYVNNGDGTFTSKEVKTPRYKTEYYTEREKQPVYRDEPIYKTQYTYEIDRWLQADVIKTAGKDDEPKWGEFTLTNKQREGGREELYTVTFADKNNKTYTATLPLEQWQSFKVGDAVKLTFKGGRLDSINDVPYQGR